MLSAGVAVRLEQPQQAILIAAARGFERGANFGGMMAVIVDEGDAIEDAFDFEAAAHTGKFGESGADQVGRNIQRERDGGSGGGFAYSMNFRVRRAHESHEI